MSPVEEIAVYLATEDGDAIMTEDGDFIGYLIQIFADAAKDTGFRNALLPVYEEFRQRQEFKIKAFATSALLGNVSLNAAVLSEIKATESFFKQGQTSVEAGGAFLMKTLKTLHAVGAVNAQGLKDISEEELLALLESLL